MWPGKVYQQLYNRNLSWMGRSSDLSGLSPPLHPLPPLKTQSRMPDERLVPRRQRRYNYSKVEQLFKNNAAVAAREILEGTDEFTALNISTMAEYLRPVLTSKSHTFPHPASGRPSVRVASPSVTDGIA